MRDVAVFIIGIGRQTGGISRMRCHQRGSEGRSRRVVDIGILIAGDRRLTPCPSPQCVIGVGDVLRAAARTGKDNPSEELSSQ